MNSDTKDSLTGICMFFCVWGILVTFILGIFVSVKDFVNYQSIMERSHKTPWYDKSWVRQPYTNFRLSRYPSTYYITTNGIKSQMWVVKETKVGNKDFWTVDYKMELVNHK